MEPNREESIRRRGKLVKNGNWSYLDMWLREVERVVKRLEAGKKFVSRGKKIRDSVKASQVRE